MADPVKDIFYKIEPTLATSQAERAEAFIWAYLSKKRKA